MKGYRLTQDARPDLIEIRRYTVDQWGVAQSHRYLSELRETICVLAEAPLIGRVRPEVGSKVLSFPYSSHVIYYVVHEQQMVIFAVLHKRMVPINHITEREII